MVCHKNVISSPTVKGQNIIQQDGECVPELVYSFLTVFEVKFQHNSRKAWPTDCIEAAQLVTWYNVWNHLLKVYQRPYRPQTCLFNKDYW